MTITKADPGALCHTAGDLKFQQYLVALLDGKPVESSAEHTGTLRPILQFVEDRPFQQTTPVILIRVQ